MKAGTISNSFTNASEDEVIVARVSALTKAIVPPAVHRGTYSAVVKNAIGALGVASIVVIDTFRHEVAIAAGSAPISTGVASALEGLSGVVERRYVPSDDTMRSAGVVVKKADGTVVSTGVVTPGGQTDFDSAVDKSIGAQDTAKALYSLADNIADAMESVNKVGYIVIDQSAQTVRSYIVAGSTTPSTATNVIDDVVADSTLALYHVEPDPATTGLGFFSL